MFSAVWKYTTKQLPFKDVMEQKSIKIQWKRGKLTLARIATALPRPTPSDAPLPFKCRDQLSAKQ